MIGELRAAAVSLGDGSDEMLVPEPVAKAALRSLGASVPKGATIAAAGPFPVVHGPPVVVKAYGPGIVHKSDVGAVAIGVEPERLAECADAMVARLASHGLRPDGLLVEDRVAPGVELVIGATRTPLGIVVVVGLGGIYAEILDEVATALVPVDRAAAEALLEGFRGASLLRGARGEAAADRDALIDTLLAIAGADGLVARCGAEFAALDCNPVIARPDGACVVDARLVLRPAPSPEPAPAPFPADALYTPRTVAVVGASATRAGFGNRALAAYRAFGRDSDGLVAIHPEAESIDGTPAVASAAEVPDGVDYLLIAVPAARCADAVRAAAGQARVVHVLSGGFAETGPDGARLEADLVAAARDAGVRLVGPNCIGVYAPAGRQTFLLDVPTRAGTVHVTSQSGGLAGDIVNVGGARGLRFSQVLSLGNAADVSPAETIGYAVADPAVRVIGAYLEGPTHGDALVAAFAAARGMKPVVVMTGGLSAQGARAAASHTGALASSRRVWDAVRAATGIATVERLEDLLGALTVAQRYATHPASGDAATLVVGAGGGASVLAADAADRAGLMLPPVVESAVAALRGEGFGAGTSVANPIEIGVGPAAPVDVFDTVFAAITPHQIFPDVICHVNVQSYYGYGTAGAEPLCALIGSLGTAASRGAASSSRVVLVARNLDIAPGRDADMINAAAIAADLPLFRTFDEAAAAVAAAKQFARGRDS